MSQGTIIELARQAMMLVLIMSLPPILVATALGLVVSFLQALTQLQEQTLGFAVKLIGVILAILFLGNWMTQELIDFTSQLFNRFHLLVN